MHRYIAIIWDSCNSEGVQTAQSFKAALASRADEWSVDYDGPGAIVAHARLPSKATQRYAMASGAGVVVAAVAYGVWATIQPWDDLDE